MKKNLFLVHCLIPKWLAIIIKPIAKKSGVFYLINNTVNEEIENSIDKENYTFAQKLIDNERNINPDGEYFLIRLETELHFMSYDKRG